MVFLYLTILSGSLYLLLQVWLTRQWIGTNSQNQEVEFLPLSLIIAAHNEAPNLKKYLPVWMNLDYPDYELILVLDRCTDTSRTITEQFSGDPKLKLVLIEEKPDSWAGKKWALSKGIDKARHEHLVFCDADCYMGLQWLQSVSEHFGKNHEMVLGLGYFEKAPGLLNAFQQFECAYTAFQYIALARLGLPYMAVGRNLAYTKSFFYRNGGFEAFKGRLSGDDDLLVNHYARPEFVQTMIARESRTLSLAKTSWSAYLQQKFRHISASSAYSLRSKVILGLFHFSHFFFYVGILLSLYSGLTFTFIFPFYFLRMAISWGLMYRLNQIMEIPALNYGYPVLDLLFFLYNLIVVPVGMIKKPVWSKRATSQTTPKKIEN